MAASNQDEADLLSFFLCTGVREGEAAHGCWTDLDCGARTYNVTEHIDLNFRPKDSEEGEIPVELVDLLQQRRKRYPKTRLIFPTDEGKPNGHLLRTVKRLGLRSGANCGHCRNKQVLSRATHPVCKHIILHRLRKTYATKLHENGTSPRTLMSLLRHSSLETTLRYLAEQDGETTRQNASAAFGSPQRKPGEIKRRPQSLKQQGWPSLSGKTIPRGIGKSS